MTYRGFHYRVTIPLLGACVALWVTTGTSLAGVLSVAALCVIVIAFTYPWDSWAVRRGVWDFPEDRLLFRIGVLPIEEIAFFVLQTLQVSFLTMAILTIVPSDAPTVFEVESGSLGIVGVGVLGVVALHILTKTFRASRHYLRYAWHLLVWFLPLILGQWVIGGAVLWPRFHSIALSAGIVGTLLSIADLWAVRRGIWYFDEKQITGAKLYGVLPWEEVAFFYLTSILVSQSIILFIPSSLR
jgi:lycopene cyclase domain-containing protein